ncbi:amino-acid N-acetyltransferase [Duganella sacchari]|uniref:Amino-acid acetyltransferase n=2 Tax=Duganella sacchari TaxID=551987 RepID=A0A1M7RBB4_9BURK|nr:amino-acid N-acetyltransferase [Duganella sacchari]
MSSTGITSPALRPATAADWTAIESLLTQAGLPLDGAQEHLTSFTVGDRAGAIVCAGGLEVYGDTALLRSVVVAPSQRGSGAGGLLFTALANVAQSRGVSTLYLLTTTAASFFARRGFIQAERATIPAALRHSREFQGACPATATLMSLSLT